MNGEREEVAHSFVAGLIEHVDGGAVVDVCGCALNIDGVLAPDAGKRCPPAAGPIPGAGKAPPARGRSRTRGRVRPRIDVDNDERRSAPWRKRALDLADETALDRARLLAAG